ncbi:hypothetical protein [Streptomyces xinghaiensis]|uniref:hypothetical protein n=1 Tax=Streptomyces xinghaiensis TaxID=1038928 RepID=UPI00341EF8F7
MDTRPLRIPPAVNTAVFAVACAVLGLHHPGTGLYPYAMESWIDDHQWLMRVAAGIVAPGAAAIPVLSPRSSR